MERSLNVFIITPLGQGGMGGIDRIMDAVVAELTQHPRPDLQIEIGVTRGKGSIAHSPWLVARLVARLCWLRVSYKAPDVVHVNLSSKGSTIRKIFITNLLRLLKMPYVVHLHGSGYDSYWDGLGPRLSAAVTSMFTHASLTIVLGRRWKQYVTSRTHLGDKITILANATKEPQSPPKSDRVAANTPCMILFLGHVGPRKGVPQLVEALHLIADMPGWKAVIAGNGQVDETKAQLTRLNLLNRVRLTGWVGPNTVDELLLDADILVLPSFEENLPMSVIEGMAFGLAVVTTPVGATEDIILPEVTGLLVPPGDATAIGNALRRLVGDPALRQRLGSAAIAYHRENLEITGYVERLVALWQTAIVQK